MKSKFSNIFVNGLLLALYLILMGVVSYVFNLNKSTIYNLIAHIILAFFIFFIQKIYQKKVFSGTAGYVKLLKDTFFMILIAAVINGFFTYVLFKFIDKNAIEQMLIESRNIMYNMYGEMLSDAQIEESIKISQKFITPLFLSIVSILGILFYGFIFDLITSAINKKNKKQIEDTADFDEAMKNVE